MMSIEPRNEPRMLRWFRRTYPSYNLQPLLLKRYRELEEARAFNNWLGERRQAQEGQRHLSFVTSHFYLDDFVQSSEDPNPQPLQHTPLQAIPEEGFRTPAEATDENVRLARRYQGGTRFVEDDLAEDPEAGALASNGQGPPSITDRLRSTADGAQAAADLIGAGAAGLAAAQAFRSQLPQDAAEYVRLNVLPRPDPAQPPPQIIGRPSDVERLLDEAGQRAQEERGTEAIEETAAVVRRRVR